MTQMTLTGVFRYPVKSLGGETFDALAVDRRGFVGDRQWMLVDPAGRFVSQRRQARMVLVSAGLGADGVLRCAAPGMPELEVAGAGGRRVEVTVWDDRLGALDAGPDAAGWFSRFLDQPCRLVRFAGDVVRRVDPAYAGPADQVGFADGFPFLLISQGSLDDLNRRLPDAVPMLRFRPNLVVGGCDPHAEDGWRRIRIGELSFRVAKPCSRCIVPTIDPSTATRSAEPLRSLLTYRRRDNKVYFGQNLLHDSPGRLAVGMDVEVLE